MVYSLYKDLKMRGAQVTLLIETDTIGYFASLIDKGDVCVFNLREEQFFSEIAFRRINVLHYHYSTFYLDRAKAAGLAVLYTLHNVYTWLDDAAFRARADIILQANAVLAVSHFAARYFCERANCGESALMVVPNGVNVASDANISVTAPQDFGVPDDRFVFAQYASFHRVKHHAVLVRAAERLMSSSKVPFCRRLLRSCRR